MFEPYIIPHIGRRRFLVVNEQGRDWYDPLKPYTELEYRWVLDHIPRMWRVIDAGCHHGNYSILFDIAEQLFCVDAHPSNCAITEANLALNHIRGEVICAAVAREDGQVTFSGETNGRIHEGAPVVEARKLSTICSYANLVKLDVEGAEYEIIPGALDEMKSVHTWIVEVHPQFGDAEELVQLFARRGFEVLKVDRDIMNVVPYEQSTGWNTHATIIARTR